MTQLNKVTIPTETFYKLKQEIQCFENFSDEELLLFLRLMKTESFLSGEQVFHENDSGDKMYILMRGNVGITKKMGSRAGVDVNTSLATLHSGDCFGEIGLIDNRPRSATATAINDAMVLSIGIDKLMRISSNPKYSILSFKLFRNFSIMLSARLRESNRKVVDLTARFSTRGS